MKHNFDIVIIGGGPAGMMAGISAREHDPRNALSIAIVEKNSSLGKKLLITGGGRCNVTNTEPDTRKLLLKYGEASKYLFSTFSLWNSQSTLDFLKNRGLETKVENEYRAFPITDKAQSVWNVLVQELSIKKIEIISDSPVQSIDIESDSNYKFCIQTSHGILRAQKVIIATGGTSRPDTGSTGDGYIWAQKLGLTVHKPIPSLVPLKVKDAWVSELSGVSLPYVKLTTYQFGKKCTTVKGKILFTHIGVSGPTVLNLSKHVGELLGYGDVILEVDTLPDLDYGMLNAKLQEIFKENINKKIGNSLSSLIPNSLIHVVLALSAIDPNTQCHSVTREERLHLGKNLKHLKLNIDSLLGNDKAIITSGGVDLNEIDFKSMEVKKVPGLYIIGDMLNINRPSGGYSLQLCWSTGFVSGSHSARTLHAMAEQKENN